jgi:hypothetical protein
VTAYRKVLLGDGNQTIKRMVCTLERRPAVSSSRSIDANSGSRPKFVQEGANGDRSGDRSNCGPTRFMRLESTKLYSRILPLFDLSPTRPLVPRFFPYQS